MLLGWNDTIGSSPNKFPGPIVVFFALAGLKEFAMGNVNRNGVNDSSLTRPSLQSRSTGVSRAAQVGRPVEGGGWGNAKTFDFGRLKGG